MQRLLAICLATVLSAATNAWAGTTCPGDTNGDDITDVTDLVAVVLAWGTTDAAADVNDDGIVDVGDLVQVILDWGCDATGGTTTTFTGVVTNALTDDPIEGAEVTVDGTVLVTDATGTYFGDVPLGTYDVTWGAQYFNGATDSVDFMDGVPVAIDVELDPVSGVVVEILFSGDDEPGGAATATANVVVLDGSTIVDYDWIQTMGAPAIMGGADTDTLTLDLGTRDEYREHLIDVLTEPPVTADDLPENVPLPPGEFPAGLQNRFQVVGTNPFAIEEAGVVAVEVDVTTTSGVWSSDGELHTVLPWMPATGLRNVPLFQPVILHAKDQGAYDWAMVAPALAGSTLDGATTRNAEFTPDWPGIYDVTVTDESTASPVQIRIFAGNWRGVVVGEDMDGRPIADSSCTGCHSNLNQDKFEPWRQTGHAEIFTDNFNTSTHWGPQCFACHTVGYDTTAFNGGIDDQADYDDFIGAGLINNPSPDNWSTMLADFPDSAQLANVQCENCHGPQWGFFGQGSSAHGPVQPAGEPRVSISSDVCATCHGEPARHARFQQWQLSAHANYELAIDEGDSGNCSRCHTGNGFLTWLPILLGDEPGDPLDNISVAWNSENVHPQTCVTCHDPHMSGTTSGDDPNATVRISGDTPPLIAGFTATDVGRGAICMTCHNSRRGLHNEMVWPDFVGTSEVTRAPHGSAQADLLMGENAYFVATGNRGSHSTVEDACIACHMEATPPPDILSYNQGGTNHTFYARTDICSECHEAGVTAASVQTTTTLNLGTVAALLENAWLDVIETQTAMGNVIDLDGDVQIMDAAEIDSLVFGESRGRQALTVIFTDMSEYGPYSLTDIDVLSPSLMTLGPIYGYGNDVMLKAGWNWTLIENDGSLGIHNVSFTNLVLSTSINQLALLPCNQPEDAARPETGRGLPAPLSLDD